MLKSLKIHVLPQEIDGVLKLKVSNGVFKWKISVFKRWGFKIEDVSD